MTQNDTDHIEELRTMVAAMVAAELPMVDAATAERAIQAAISAADGEIDERGLIIKILRAYPRALFWKEKWFQKACELEQENTQLKALLAEALPCVDTEHMRLRSSGLERAANSRRDLFERIKRKIKTMKIPEDHAAERASS